VNHQTHLLQKAEELQKKSGTFTYVPSKFKVGEEMDGQIGQICVFEALIFTDPHGKTSFNGA